MAVTLIVLIYLCNSMYREIGEGIHHLSHFVETIYDFQSSAAHQDELHAHSFHNHTRQQTVHEHSAIAVLYSLFEASNKSDHKEEGIPFELKIDKHLVGETFYIPPYSGSKVHRKFEVPENRISLGHINKLLQPPRSF